MKKYKSPEMHFLGCIGELQGKEIAQMSDKELTDYLKENYFPGKKRKPQHKPDFTLNNYSSD